jgi:agmatine deiminase
MIADADAKVVFVADTLASKFPDVFRGLRSILGRHGVPLKIILGTRDIWCRDYMPVQVAENRMVQFRYAPDYLKGRFERFRADGELSRTLPWLKGCVRSRIVLDGGNVVGWRDKAIVTDKIYKENPWIERASLRDRLKRLLRIQTLIVIPKEPCDPIGHADGMVRFVDETAVVVNDFSEVSEKYRARVVRCLEGNGLGWTEIPYQPQRGQHEGIPSAAGNWINFLRVGSLVIIPVFGLACDQSVCDILRGRFPCLTIKGLPCRDLANQGGVLNCVTWCARVGDEIRTRDA